MLSVKIGVKMTQVERITIRVPKWVKEELDKRKEINWSQKIRDDLISYIKKEDVPIELRMIIRKYLEEENKDMLTALFLYSQIYETVDQPLKTNFSIMFGKKSKDVENELGEVLKKLGIKDRWDKVFQERNFCDILLDTLVEEGVIDYLEEETTRTFENTENKEELAKALWHLALYLDGKTDNIIIRSEYKKMEILFGHLFEKPKDIIEKLNTLGIIFYNYYDSNAYSYPIYEIPVYSYKLILDVHKNPYKYGLYGYGALKSKTETIISEKKNRDFLRWLKDSYAIDFYDEEKLGKFKGDFNSQYGEGAFENTLNELVRSGLLICLYYPYRSRAGKRSSSPASLHYYLSNPGKKHLYDIVFNKLLKESSNMGELGQLMGLYEKSIDLEDSK